MSQNRTADIKPHKHHVGDGLHYITDNYQANEDGTFSYGDSSDGCVLLNAHLLCAAYQLPTVWDLWTAVYPDDPMTAEDASYIFSQALPYTDSCVPTAPEDRADILADLRAVYRAELAERIEELLTTKGV